MPNKEFVPASFSLTPPFLGCRKNISSLPLTKLQHGKFFTDAPLIQTKQNPKWETDSVRGSVFCLQEIQEKT